MKLEMKSPLPLKYVIFDSPDYPSYMNRVLNWIEKHGAKCAGELTQETGISISAVKKSLSYLSKPKVNKLTKLNPGHRPTLYGLVQPTPLREPVKTLPRV